MGAPLGVKALGRIVRDRKRAGAITSGFIVLEPKCHPSSPVIVGYWVDAGSLVLECSTCHEPVCQIAVGK